MSRMADLERIKKGPDVSEATVGVMSGRRLRLSLSTITLLVVVLLVESFFFSVRSPYFLNWDNWLNILTAAAIIGILAAPGTALLITRQFDLSVGSGVAFVGAVLAIVASRYGLAAGVGAGILAGLALGVINGFLVTVVEVNALITTLGTLAAFRGLTEVFLSGHTVILSGFSGLGTARAGPDVPVPVLIAIAVALAFWFMMRYTTYGRSLYAIGANPVAARLVGIRSGRRVFVVFLMSGAAIALGGLVNASQLGAASPITALGLELSVITAVVLGGTSLAGGRGSIEGTMVGLVVVSVLNNGMVLMNVDPFWQDVARGALLIAAVAFDRVTAKFTGLER